MKEITHHQFSLFSISKGYPESPRDIKIIQTFWTLESAKTAQEKIKEKTIIIPTY